jgi:hypothetical protein
MLKSSKEEIMDFYTDLFPHELSSDDVDCYFKDCKCLDDEPKKILLENIEYIVDKLNISGKWVSV